MAATAATTAVFALNWKSGEAETKHIYNIGIGFGTSLVYNKIRNTYIMYVYVCVCHIIEVKLKWKE